MNPLPSPLADYLLSRVRLVQQNLGQVAVEPEDCQARFGDLFDSMGMVEFLALLAEDCGVSVEQIERSAGRQFGTVAELARCLEEAGLVPRGLTAGVTMAGQQPGKPSPWLAPVAAEETPAQTSGTAWLAATAVRLPGTVQPAAALNEALGRPPGWLEAHAGIEQRWVWSDQDPLTAAAAAGRECLEAAGLAVEEVGALLVTSEAPPLLAGLAAALHHRLDLRPGAAALEVSGACTGFLAALWTARNALPRVGAALVVAVEAPCRFLTVQPGPAGEAAALFGDGAAASLLADSPLGGPAVPVRNIVLGCDGGKGDLIRVERRVDGPVELRLQGEPLAAQAIRSMADSVRDLARDHGLALTDLQGVVAHGGNGRLPGMLARRLGLPPDRVWSETPRTGNLGSASLPAAWAAHRAESVGPVIWVTVGAGLTWAAMLTGNGRTEG